MRGKASAVLFIVVFLLAAAVVGTFISEQGGKHSPAAPAVPEPTDHAATVVTAAPTTAPAPSYAPLPTAAPTATPAPTPAPTPTPQPVVIPSPPPTEAAYGSSLGSGSFSSDTGVGLNIRADWSAKTLSSSQAEVTVAVSVNSYSLHLVAVPKAVNLNLGGQYTSLDAPAIDYDGSGSINTPLASKTFTVDLSEGESTSLHLDVVWSFGGTYQELELPSIECGGDISLSR